MTLPAFMRIEKSWTVTRMTSGGGWHIAIVKDRKADTYRLLFCQPHIKNRWSLSASMKHDVASTIFRKAQDSMVTGHGPLRAFRDARDYSRAIHPKQFATHRRELAGRVEIRRMAKVPGYGIF